jgi:hypothetical protein
LNQMWGDKNIVEVERARGKMGCTGGDDRET